MHRAKYKKVGVALLSFLFCRAKHKSKNTIWKGRSNMSLGTSNIQPEEFGGGRYKYSISSDAMMFRAKEAGTYVQWDDRYNKTLVGSDSSTLAPNSTGFCSVNIGGGGSGFRTLRQDRSI